MKINNDYNKKIAVKEWIRLGNPELTHDVIQTIRRVCMMGIMDTKKAILEYKNNKL